MVLYNSFSLSPKQGYKSAIKIYFSFLPLNRFDSKCTGKHHRNVPHADLGSSFMANLDGSAHDAS